MAQQEVRTEIICSDCGKTTTVPFKPKPGKAVYCRECLAKHRPKPKTHKTTFTHEEKQAWSRRRNHWKQT
jgi:CxxC-x17-CxxC domain-containing protein